MLTAMLGTKYRGRRKGVRVRDGSVREARQEAGLSLAQVAGDDVSRTAIHLIEQGRNKPSLETLRHIARRTRKPLEFFLVEDGIDLDAIHELETFTAQRDHQKVIAFGTELLGRKWAGGDLALIHFYLGQAYCRLVDPVKALEHLRPARSHFELTEDEWMVVEAMDWEASALGLLEDPDAISLARQALERCRRLEPKMPQLEARILGHLAGMYVVRESWAQAVSLYEAATVAAGSVKDLLQQAKMHHGLGTAYQRLLQPSQARRHFDRALALYALESDLSAVYRVENDLGCLLLQEGQLDRAEKHLSKALAGTDELNIDRRGRGFVLRNLGEVRLRKGDHAAALALFNDALAAAEDSGERIVLAEVHGLLGELHETAGNSSLADEHFETALSVLADLQMPDRLRDCHMRYAEILSRRHDIERAAQHWKRAAEIGKGMAAGLGASGAWEEVEERLSLADRGGRAG